MIAEPDSSAGRGGREDSGNPQPILFVEDIESDFDLARRQLTRSRIANPLHCVSTVEQLGDYMSRTGRYSDLQNVPLPAVVVLDMMLQQNNGLEAQAMLRANLRWRKIPVVVISSRERMSAIKTAVELGADAFMLKPFKVEEFRRLGIKLHLPLSIENGTSAKD